MKKRTLYSLLMIGALSFSSCTDFLEKEPLDVLTDNADFWTNEASVETYANAFYNQFSGYGNYGGTTGEMYYPHLHDNQAGSGFTNWNYTNAPASNSNWSATYDEIRRCNSMIVSLNEYATGVMDPATLNHWLGVARLMRAYQYWDLVRKFGDAPYTEEVVDINSPVLYAARDDRDMIMDKVLDDLNFAVANIQGGSQTTWSNDMAQAFKARICLWEGTFRKYRVQGEGSTKGPDAAGAEKFLNACVDACNAIMGKYTLNMSDGGYQALYNSIDLAGNTEVIFYKRYIKDIFDHSLIAYTTASTMQHGLSKDAFDAYLKLDGTEAGPGEDVGVWKQSAVDGGMHINLENIFATRDKRMGWTLDPNLSYPGNGWMRVTGDAPMSSSTGYTFRIFDNTKEIDPVYRVNTSANYTCAPIFWISEVYLNYAEAKAELGTLTQSDLNNTVNKLRERAGLPALTTTPASMLDEYYTKSGKTITPLLFEIRRERRIELMPWSETRYWDLIRWHELDRLDTGEYPDVITGANMTPDEGGATLDLINGYIDASNGMTRTYDPKHYLYPLPTTQFTLNPALEQNPGWERTSVDEDEE